MAVVDHSIHDVRAITATVRDLGFGGASLELHFDGGVSQKLYFRCFDTASAYADAINHVDAAAINSLSVKVEETA